MKLLDSYIWLDAVMVFGWENSWIIVNSPMFTLTTFCAYGIALISFSESRYIYYMVHYKNITHATILVF